jgi:hypothetical protein
MGPQEKNDENQRSGEDSSPRAESGAGGYSGEGAASAMRQMISQNSRLRHQSGEAGNAAGHGQ